MVRRPDPPAPASTRRPAKPADKRQPRQRPKAAGRIASKEAASSSPKIQPGQAQAGREDENAAFQHGERRE